MVLFRAPVVKLGLRVRYGKRPRCEDLNRVIVLILDEPFTS